jgi:DNA-binding GntR family transcriptional regulator
VTEPARGFLEPLVQQSTPSIIADKLRSAIGHGHLPPGAQLGEADLARDLGVSRGPLREGIQRLTQEGLLVSIRNRGVFVIEMTPSAVRDLYVARAAVERAAGALLVRRGTAADELLDQVARMAAAGKGRAGVDDAVIGFHETLVGLAESPRLSRVHRTLLTETRMCLPGLDPEYAVSAERVAAHRDIAEAVQKGKAPAVDRLLVRHMDEAFDRLSD